MLVVIWWLRRELPEWKKTNTLWSQSAFLICDVIIALSGCFLSAERTVHFYSYNHRRRRRGYADSSILSLYLSSWYRGLDAIKRHNTFRTADTPKKSREQVTFQRILSCFLEPLCIFRTASVYTFEQEEVCVILLLLSCVHPPRRSLPRSQGMSTCHPKAPREL